MAGFEPWNADRAAAVIAGFPVSHGHEAIVRPDDPEPAQSLALPILHALQAVFGCIPPDALPMVAAHLNASRADVHGIVSFYHDFRTEPPGRHTLRLCRAEACQAVGAGSVADAVQDDLGIGWHETTAGGGVTLEPVFCLGLCASGPAAMLDGAPVGRLTISSAQALLRGLR